MWYYEYMTTPLSQLEVAAEQDPSTGEITLVIKGIKVSTPAPPPDVPDEPENPDVPDGPADPGNPDEPPVVPDEPPVVPDEPTGPKVTKTKELAVGAGGMLTGLSFSDDGSTFFIAGDGTANRWDFDLDRWVLLVSTDTMPEGYFTAGDNVGGGVSAVAVNPVNGNVGVMAYDDAVFKTIDGGRHWVKVLTAVPNGPNDNFRNRGEKLVYDRQNTDVVYYGSALNGLFVSTNAGDTWTNVPKETLPYGLVLDLDDSTQPHGKVDRKTYMSLASAGISSICVDHKSPKIDGRSSVVYAAVYGEGVYKSTDAAATWTKLDSVDVKSVLKMRLLGDSSIIVISQKDPINLTANSQVWVYNGAWVNKTPTGGGRDWKTIAEDPFNPGKVVMTAGGGKVLAMTKDYANTWVVATGHTTESANDIPWLAGSLGSTGWLSPTDFKFDPLVPNKLWVSEGVGIWYINVPDTLTATDSTAWHCQSRGIEQLVPNDTISPPGGKPVLASWDRPIFVSEDQDTYPLFYGPTNAFGSCWGLDYAVDDPTYIVASVASHQYPGTPVLSGISRDGGRSWTPFAKIPLDSTNATDVWGYGFMAVSTAGNIVWVPSYGKRPYYTKDHGNTWTPIELPGFVDADYKQINPKAYFVSHRCLVADAVKPGVFYLYVSTGAKIGLYRSEDGAATWTKVSDKIATGVDFSWHLRMKAVDGKEGELFLTPGQLSGATTTKFFRSNDKGATWSVVPGATAVSDFGFGKAAPGSDYPAIYIAGYVDGVYGIFRSDDNAQTWNLLTQFPAGKVQGVSSLDGDKDEYGRFYLAFNGTGWAYGELV